jgi:hypothetical protein
MLKIILLLMVSFVLFGCSPKDNQEIYDISHSSQPAIASISLSEASYNKFLEGFAWCNRIESSDVRYQCELFPWYLHFFDISHLGVRLSYDQNYGDDHYLFLQKDPEPFLATNKDMVYSIQDPTTFIKKITKDPSKSIEDVVASFSLPQGCILNSQINQTNPDIVVYDGSLSPACHDTQGKYPIYLFSKTKTNYYYLWNDNLDCALHPCSAFDTPYIEIFLN